VEDALKQPIRIEGARTHNLRAIACEIPAEALTVVTGVSGSGKSSLVFDTLYAEGQRRFVQSMSTYTRLFLERMERPDVDFISNIPPAIALAQKNTIRNARSTVGTITEINDYLRLLFTHLGETRCIACGGLVARDDPQTAMAELESVTPGITILVTAPFELGAMRVEDAVQDLLRQGYRRIFVGDELVVLDEVDAASLSGKLGGATISADGPTHRPAVVIDRVIAGKVNRSRLREGLEAAFGLGGGRAILVLVDPSGGGKSSKRIVLDRRFSCRSCGREHAEPVPHLFSFNSPLGACTVCQGFGRVVGVDLEKVIPDHRKALAEGAVVPWTTPANLELQEWLLRAAKDAGVRTDVPFAALDAAERAFVIEGEPHAGERKGVKSRTRRHRFPGVLGFFRWLERKRYKTHVRILLARYRGYTRCTACDGKRLKPEALAVRIAGSTIAALTERTVGEILDWCGELTLSARENARSVRLLAEVRRRLSYLTDVGLDYLTLARQARTLSGGEAQRIHLASALGSSLTDTLYCLDEPTVGLHARDSRRLLRVLRKLTAVGNTVVVVEHDPVLIEGADHLVDLGPGGGAGGGRVLYAGPPAQIAKASSATGRSLRLRGAADERRARPAARQVVVVRGARENNLKGITVEIPYDRLTCVTGVSGSGKSTLVEQVLYNGWLRRRGDGGVEAGACDSIEGLDAFAEVVLMTQAPVGRSARSNAATYLKAYDEIRKLFAATPDARLGKVPPGHFSFNTSGGRCETCLGIGTVTIEMHFMADLTVTCDDCGGARFKPHVRAIRWRGRSINDVLAMTIDEAHELFAEQRKVRERLAALRAVGLGYLALGQATSTLSGGEAQRLKLASFVDAGAGARKRLLIFDEPTTGLHLSDVARLLGVLHDLVEQGNTVLVVEHNLDFIAAADWIVDLGPEGGDRGGEVVATGPPLEVARSFSTPTAVALRELFGVSATRSAGARVAAARPPRRRRSCRDVAPPPRPDL
jgi:excinuclease ABC subunit A